MEDLISDVQAYAGLTAVGAAGYSFFQSGRSNLESYRNNEKAIAANAKVTPPTRPPAKPNGFTMSKLGFKQTNDVLNDMAFHLNPSTPMQNNGLGKYEYLRKDINSAFGNEGTFLFSHHGDNMPINAKYVYNKINVNIGTLSNEKGLINHYKGIRSTSVAPNFFIADNINNIKSMSKDTFISNIKSFNQMKLNSYQMLLKHHDESTAIRLLDKQMAIFDNAISHNNNFFGANTSNRQSIARNRLHAIGFNKKSGIYEPIKDLDKLGLAEFARANKARVDPNSFGSSAHTNIFQNPFGESIMTEYAKNNAGKLSWNGKTTNQLYNTQGRLLDSTLGSDIRIPSMLEGMNRNDAHIFSTNTLHIDTDNSAVRAILDREGLTNPLGTEGVLAFGDFSKKIIRNTHTHTLNMNTITDAKRLTSIIDKVAAAKYISEHHNDLSGVGGFTLKANKKYHEIDQLANYITKSRYKGNANLSKEFLESFADGINGSHLETYNRLTGKQLSLSGNLASTIYGDKIVPGVQAIKDMNIKHGKVSFLTETLTELDKIWGTEKGLIVSHGDDFGRVAEEILRAQNPNAAPGAFDAIKNMKSGIMLGSDKMVKSNDFSNFRMSMADTLDMANSSDAKKNAMKSLGWDYDEAKKLHDSLDGSTAMEYYNAFKTKGLHTPSLHMGVISADVGLRSHGIGGSASASLDMAESLKRTRLTDAAENVSKIVNDANGYAYRGYLQDFAVSNTGDFKRYGAAEVHHSFSNNTLSNINNADDINALLSSMLKKKLAPDTRHFVELSSEYAKQSLQMGAVPLPSNFADTSYAYNVTLPDGSNKSMKGLYDDAFNNLIRADNSGNHEAIENAVSEYKNTMNNIVGSKDFFKTKIDNSLVLAGQRSDLQTAMDLLPEEKQRAILKEHSLIDNGIYNYDDWKAGKVNFSEVNEGHFNKITNLGKERLAILNKNPTTGALSIGPTTMVNSNKIRADIGSKAVVEKNRVGLSGIAQSHTISDTDVDSIDFYHGLTGQEELKQSLISAKSERELSKFSMLNEKGVLGYVKQGKPELEADRIGLTGDALKSVIETENARANNVGALTNAIDPWLNTVGNIGKDVNERDAAESVAKMMREHFGIVHGGDSEQMNNIINSFKPGAKFDDFKSTVGTMLGTLDDSGNGASAEFKDWLGTRLNQTDSTGTSTMERWFNQTQEYMTSANFEKTKAIQSGDAMAAVKAGLRSTGSQTYKEAYSDTGQMLNKVGRANNRIADTFEGGFKALKSNKLAVGAAVAAAALWMIKPSDMHTRGQEVREESRPKRNIPQPGEGIDPAVGNVYKPAGVGYNFKVRGRLPRNTPPHAMAAEFASMGIATTGSVTNRDRFADDQYAQQLVNENRMNKWNLA